MSFFKSLKALLRSILKSMETTEKNEENDGRSEKRGEMLRQYLTSSRGLKALASASLLR